MGALCEKVDKGDFPLPDTSNSCSDNIGSTHPIPHFCTLAGDAIGGGYRQEYCNKLGDDEWEKYHTGDSCQYNDCHPYQQWETGCCRGCCGIDGRGVVCERTAFRGDATDCCLQDYDGSGGSSLKNSQDLLFQIDGTQEPFKPKGIYQISFNERIVSKNLEDSVNTLCFQYNTNEKKTCDPKFRNITSSTCVDPITDFCTGADLPIGDSDWISRWVNPDGTPLSGWQPGDDPKTRGCFYAINRYVGPDPNAIDAKGYARAQILMESVFTRYEADGFIIGSAPGQIGFNNFQDSLRTQVCNLYPGLCKSALNSTCSNYTLNDLVNNPELSFWCGCYLADTEYSKYVDGYQISKECSPPCNRSGVIPIAGGDGIPIPCGQSVCLIDDLTVNLVQSQVAGGLQFEQVCGNCGDGGVCSCVVENNNIDIVSSQIGGSLVLNQNCVSSNCTKMINGQSVAVPCADFATNPIASYQANVENSNSNTNRTRNLIILIGILAVILIVFFFLLILRPNFNPRSRPGYIKR